MTDVILEGKILAWGNSYGIRIRKEDLERAGLAAGGAVKVRIETPDRRIDLSHFHFLKGGRPDDSERHDELLGEARSLRLKRGKGARRRA